MRPREDCDLLVLLLMRGSQKDTYIGVLAASAVAQELGILGHQGGPGIALAGYGGRVDGTGQF